MATALDTARYLVLLSEQQEEAEPVTNLRLQKLLYYVQGWSLAARQRPMFADRIEAWRHGPVVPSVYAKVRNESQPIEVADLGVPDSLSEQDERFIHAIWDHYKKFAANELRRMTHAERPWRKAWGNLAPDDSGNEVITPESMRDFFIEEQARQANDGVRIQDLRDAEAELAAGQTVSLAELEASLGDGV